MAGNRLLEVKKTKDQVEKSAIKQYQFSREVVEQEIRYHEMSLRTAALLIHEQNNNELSKIKDELKACAQTLIKLNEDKSFASGQWVFIKVLQKNIKVDHLAKSLLEDKIKELTRKNYDLKLPVNDRFSYELYRRQPGISTAQYEHLKQIHARETADLHDAHSGIKKLINDYSRQIEEINEQRDIWNRLDKKESIWGYEIAKMVSKLTELKSELQQLKETHDALEAEHRQLMKYGASPAQQTALSLTAGQRSAAPSMAMPPIASFAPPIAMTQAGPFAMPPKAPFAAPVTMAQAGPFAMPPKAPFAAPVAMAQAGPFAMPPKAPFAAPVTMAQAGPFAMPPKAPFAPPVAMALAAPFAPPIAMSSAASFTPPYAMHLAPPPPPFLPSSPALPATAFPVATTAASIPIPMVISEDNDLSFAAAKKDIYAPPLPLNSNEFHLMDNTDLSDGFLRSSALMGGSQIKLEADPSIFKENLKEKDLFLPFGKDQVDTFGWAGLQFGQDMLFEPKFEMSPPIAFGAGAGAGAGMGAGSSPPLSARAARSLARSMLTPAAPRSRAPKKAQELNQGDLPDKVMKKLATILKQLDIQRRALNPNLAIIDEIGNLEKARQSEVSEIEKWQPKTKEMFIKVYTTYVECMVELASAIVSKKSMDIYNRVVKKYQGIGLKDFLLDNMKIYFLPQYKNEYDVCKNKIINSLTELHKKYGASIGEEEQKTSEFVGTKVKEKPEKKGQASTAAISKKIDYEKSAAILPNVGEGQYQRRAEPELIVYIEKPDKKGGLTFFEEKRNKQLVLDAEENTLAKQFLYRDLMINSSLTIEREDGQSMYAHVCKKQEIYKQLAEQEFKKLTSVTIGKYANYERNCQLPEFQLALNYLSRSKRKKTPYQNLKQADFDLNMIRDYAKQELIKRMEDDKNVVSVETSGASKPARAKR